MPPTLEAPVGPPSDPRAATVAGDAPTIAEEVCAPPSPATRSWASWAAAAWASSTRRGRSGSTASCALKMILAGEHAGPEAAVRFLAEAEAVAKLQHPNIVQIFHVDEHAGRPYFEMEYVEGGSLADRLDGTPRPPRRGGAAGRDPGRRDGRGASPGGRPPRPQAGQHPPDVRRHAQDRRLRPRQAAERRLGADADRLGPGLAQLHGPRAGRGQDRGHRPGGRRVRAGGDPLRAAHRPPAVPGGDGARHAPAGQDGRAGAAVAAGAGPAAGRRDDRPEVPAEGPGQARTSRPPRWPRTCVGSRPASRSWRGRWGRWSGAGGGAVGTRSWPGRSARRRRRWWPWRCSPSSTPIASAVSPPSRPRRLGEDRLATVERDHRAWPSVDYERGQAACEKGEIGPGLLWTDRELALGGRGRRCSPGSTPPAPTWPPGKASTPGSWGSSPIANPVVSVAFSPDGKTVLTGSIDDTARLWDAATGQPIGEPLHA